MTQLIDDGHYGPAMRKLNERQRKFVLTLLTQRKRNFVEAARWAGYEGEDNVMRATASRLASDEKILDALDEETSRRLRQLQPLGTSALEDVVSAGEDKDKLKAAQIILTATGALVQKTEQKRTVEHIISDEAMIARMGLMAKFLGMDIQKLLGARAPVIDVTPEVKPTDGRELAVPDELKDLF